MYGEKKVRSGDKQKEPMQGCQALMHMKLAQFQMFGPQPYLTGFILDFM
jgi:hypothetical protein